MGYAQLQAYKYDQSRCNYSPIGVRLLHFIPARHNLNISDNNVCSSWNLSAALSSVASWCLSWKFHAAFPQGPSPKLNYSPTLLLSSILLLHLYSFSLHPLFSSKWSIVQPISMGGGSETLKIMILFRMWRTLSYSEVRITPSQILRQRDVESKTRRQWAMERHTPPYHQAQFIKHLSIMSNAIKSDRE